MTKLNILTDEETLYMLECVQKILMCYYQHNEQIASMYIERFYHVYTVEEGWDDDRYHYEAALRVAAIIHLHLHLNIRLKDICYEKEEIYTNSINYVYSKESIAKTYIQCYGVNDFMENRRNTRLYFDIKGLL